MSVAAVRRAGPAVLAAVVLMFALLPRGGTKDSVLREITLIATLTLIVSGFNVAYGYAGELAIGQVAMYAIGAYAGGFAMTRGLDLSVGLLVAGLAAALLGLVTSVPGLRLAGWGLAMTTFFLILLIPDVVQLLNPYTGGLVGMTNIPVPTLFGQDLDSDAFYTVTIVVCGLWLLFVRNVMTSSIGTNLLMLRQSPVLARSIGINVYRSKVFAYTLAAVPAGLAGCLLAGRDQFVTPGYFTLTLTISVIAASILGGPRTVYGAVFGAAIIQLITDKSDVFAKYAYPAYGAILVLSGLFLRNGLVGLIARYGARFERRFATRAPAPAPPDVTPPTADGVELTLTDLVKTFDGVHAVQDLTLTASPGTVTALIGANGSGKTTTINLIGGFNKPDSGRISLGDGDITPFKADKVARMGVARTFQTPILPSGLTVREIVAAAALGPGHRTSLLAAALRLPGYRRATRDRFRLADAHLARTGLTALADREGSALPLGQRRLVEVVRALAARPRVLLLDEPASGLDHAEVRQLADIVGPAARTDGLTVLLVEHNFELVSSVADYIYVLESGRLIAQGRPDEVRENPVVLRSYLGDAERAPA